MSRILAGQNGWTIATARQAVADGYSPAHVATMSALPIKLLQSAAIGREELIANAIHAPLSLRSPDNWCADSYNADDDQS